jgi:exosortase/archaeosortase family protein
VAVGGAWLARSAGFEVQADGTALAAGARMLEVTPECAAIDALSIFVAGVLAFPCDWRRKALGASAGLLLIMVANIGRIGLLGGLAASRPAHFDSVHEKFMHVFPLAVVLPLWLAWIVWIARPRAPRREAPVLT